jgi:hypothetical protein
MANDQFGYGGASKDNTEHQNPDLPEHDRAAEEEGESDRGVGPRGLGRPSYAGSRYAGARTSRPPRRASSGATRRGPRDEGDDPRHRGGGPSRRQGGGPSSGNR